ncbi:helix-turn-helix domain-containing protein [Spirosoma sp. HMF4905]|uniref:Helix-turn-helix domain-containing protein n=1 Tax=Spirosoma arboris TaxID=2682092 RepID=A0A7K1SJZ4_9BACT|nr:helix-turn-helix transcriptional regulator [Spirosoma arboris]MVM34131.1 helix-turn-helix domain-containing protein [Spirosoma arboris]
MKKEPTPPYVFHSVSELHKALGLPKPLHPLVSLSNYQDIRANTDEIAKGMMTNMYKISYKKHYTGKVRYGQSYYDFDEGGLCFVSPNQLITESRPRGEYEGFTLIIHPDFLRPYPLGKTIKNYGFFSYSSNEALHLSEKEKETIMGVFGSIGEELALPIDQYSQDVIVSQIELLLNYSNRFYNRQFITRKAANHDILTKLETLLADYFDSQKPLIEGLPTVQYISEQLAVSPHYLSDMLRSLTGMNTQQHIHNKLIDKAKEILSTSNLTTAEVAYQLGFEHPQSFNKIFKRKTNVSPIEFRQSFN